MDPPPLEIAAERWSGAPGHLRAEGGVVATTGDETLTAAWVELDADRRLLVLSDGTWTRPGIGTLSFATLALRRSEGGWEGTATGASFRGIAGEKVVRVTGESLTWRADGTVAGERVTVSPCDCAVPPLGVRARRVVVSEREASFRGGWLELAGLPVLPVPVGEIPLARRSGLLPPVLGYGDDGFRAATPLYLTLGRAADATLAPEIRTERSLRGLGELRYAVPGGRGALAGSVGTDWQADATRGAAELAHHASRGATGAAVQAQVLGDEAYLVDYADAYLARATPWVESRAWAGAGPIEVFGSAFQLDPRATDRAGAAVRWPVALPGAVHLELEGTGIGTPGGAAAGGALRVVRETWAGPLRARPELAGGADATGTAWGTGALELALPIWNGARTFAPSIRGVAGAGERPAIDGLPVGGLGAPPIADAVPPWSLEPGLRYTAPAGEARVGAAARPEGVRGAANATWSAGRLTGWGQVETAPASFVPDLAGGATWIRVGPVEAGAVGVFTTRLDLPLASAAPSAGWTLPGPLAGLRVGAAGLFDLADPAWRSATASLRWTHPQRCLGADVLVRIDADEPPSVRFALDLDP